LWVLWLLSLLKTARQHLQTLMSRPLAGKKVRLRCPLQNKVLASNLQLRV
jgi:hypothetical protein